MRRRSPLVPMGAIGFFVEANCSTVIIAAAVMFFVGRVKSQRYTRGVCLKTFAKNLSFCAKASQNRTN